MFKPFPWRGFPNVKLDHLFLCLSLPIEAEKRKKIIINFFSLSFLTPLKSQFLPFHQSNFCYYIHIFPLVLILWYLLITGQYWPTSLTQNFSLGLCEAAPILSSSHVLLLCPLCVILITQILVFSKVSSMYILYGNSFSSMPSTIILMGVHHKY